MALDDYAYLTWTQDELVELRDPRPLFLLDTFFPTVKTFTAATISWDIVEAGRKIAPFVSPFVAGKPTRRNGYRTYDLKPAYIKLADTATSADGFTRLAGEKYGGELSPGQRLDQITAELIDQHHEMIETRLEKMAAEVLVNSQLTITADDYPTALVDFERPVGNVLALGGAALWNTLTADPLGDIEAMSFVINKASRGASVDTLLMRTSTFDLLKGHADFRELLDVAKNLSPSTAGEFDLAPNNTRDATQRGKLSGKWEIWTYDATYEDDFGVAQPFLPEGEVIFVAREAIEGAQYYGPVMDIEAMDENPNGVERYTKTRTRWDPSGVDVITQSAPLVGMRRPSASGRLTVI